MQRVIRMPPPISRTFQGEGWQVFLADLKQESFNIDMLYDFAYRTTRSKEYWCNRLGISKLEFHNIDWDAVGPAFHSLPWGHQRWLSKAMAGFSAMGRVMRRWGESSHDKCPRCDRPNEDAQHVLLCSDTNDLWSDEVKDIRDVLKSYNTYPPITEALIHGLSHWRIAGSCFVSSNQEVSATFQDQSNIGWFNVFCGRLSKKWRPIQDRWLALSV